MTKKRAAIVGIGYSRFSRSASPEMSILALAQQACAAAIEDAGLLRNEVDGMASFMVMHDSVPCQAVATTLALPGLTFSLDIDLGGQAPCHLVNQAASAVLSGQANTVVVFRAMNGHSGSRVGAMRFPGEAGDFRYPIGYDSYMMYVAMWAKRFLYETHQGLEDMAAVAISQRGWAADNDRAVRRDALDLSTYLDSPYVVEPFRAPDCTIEVDGACAVVVTALDRALDLRHAPAVISAGGYQAGPRSGLDIGDHMLWEDYTRNYSNLLAPRLYRQAQLDSEDLDFAEIYDCFTSTVLMGLEGFGVCGRGESGAFVRSGATGRGGSFPVNTHGGLLSEGYLHGMNTVAEAALQIQGRAGVRQVPKHQNCLVSSGALMDGSGLILSQL